MPFSFYAPPKLSPEEVSPMAGAVSRGLEAFTGGMKAAYLPSQLKEDLAKEQLANEASRILQPYLGPQAKADLEKIQLANQLARGTLPYDIEKAKLGPSSLQSEISLRQAQTEVEKLKSKYPGLGESGVVGTLAYASYLSDNPQIADSIRKASSQKNNPGVLGSPNQSTQSVGDYQDIPSLSNPIDLLTRSAYTDLNYKNILTKSIEKNLSARDYDKMPVSEKTYAIAQARSFGYTAQEASKAFQEGKTLRDLAESKGYDRNDTSSWPIARSAPTTAMQTQVQRANSALAGVNVVEPFLEKAYGNYSGRFLNVAPDLIKDMIKNENIDKQSDIFAAYMLTPEVNALRIRAMGGNVGIGAIRHLEDVAHQKINTLGLSPRSEVYKLTLNKVSKMIEKMNRAENNAIYKQQAEMDEKGEEPEITQTDITKLSDEELRKIANG